MASRSELRRERYAELRKAGFSVKEAQKLRDNSTQTIQRRIRQRRTEQIPEQFPKVIGTRNQRLDDFRRWSKARRFPRIADDFISRANVDSGHDILDSYGYRLFYHMYVNKLPEAEAIRALEANDT